MAKILIVDDSPTDIEFMKKALVGAGHTVHVATSGQDAIDEAKQISPDCIVMDVVMPGVNGFQATRALRKNPNTQNTPIIVISSKNQETDRVWALRQGANEYVVKPVKEADLISKVAAVTAGK